MTATTKVQRQAGLPWHEEILDAISYHLAIIGRNEGSEDAQLRLVEKIADHVFCFNVLFPPDVKIIPLLSDFLMAMHSGTVTRRSNSVEAHVHAFNEWYRLETATAAMKRRNNKAKDDTPITPEQARAVLSTLVKIYGSDFPAFADKFEKSYPGFKTYIERMKQRALRGSRA